MKVGDYRAIAGLMFETQFEPAFADYKRNSRGCCGDPPPSGSSILATLPREHPVIKLISFARGIGRACYVLL